jgi:lipopolysaccharide export system protein LptA
MKKNNQSIIIYLIALFSLLVSANATALDTDAEQPITIDSNTATYDDLTSTSTYTGNVVSVQGSIVVHSDKLVVYFVNGDADKLVFTGNKAKFKQTPSIGAKDITGESFIGHFFPKANQLVLIDNATVWKDDGIYASDLIEYNTSTSLVNAGEKASDTKRVHVILKPKNKEQPSKKNPK